jgi:hypothetical protein
MATKLAFRWILANAAAWGLVGGLDLAENLRGWLLSGALVGMAQWLALRSMRLSPLWIAGTCLAWAAGLWTAAEYGHLWYVDFLQGGIVGGALAGVVQAWALRRRVRWPALWMPATICASALGLSLAQWIEGKVGGGWAFWAFGATAGLVMGAVPAPVLWWMVRKPPAGAAAGNR